MYIYIYIYVYIYIYIYIYAHIYIYTRIRLGRLPLDVSLLSFLFAGPLISLFFIISLLSKIAFFTEYQSARVTYIRNGVGERIASAPQTPPPDISSAESTEDLEDLILDGGRGVAAARIEVQVA